MRGSVTAEFAIVAPLLFFLIFGIVDFGNLFRVRVALTDAARNGARYASVHPTGWSTAQPAASASVQGRVQQAGEVKYVTNDDAHIEITYFDSAPSTPVLCGHFSASAGAFIPDNGYAQASCVIPGNLVAVKARSNYKGLTFVSSMIAPDGFDLGAETTMVIEQ